MKKIYSPLLIILFFSSAPFLFAQDALPEEGKASAKLRFLLTGALEFGGDEVAKVYFTNGKTQSVKAGQGGAIGAGVQLGLGASEKFLLRGTVGFKYVTTQADNAHIRLTRVPINLTANIMATEKFRLGAGIAMHNAIKFKADGIGSDFSLKNASGPIFEIAYRGVGISYTAMKYTDNLNETYSANAIGITLSGVFPRK